MVTGVPVQMWSLIVGIPDLCLLHCVEAKLYDRQRGKTSLEATEQRGNSDLLKSLIYDIQDGRHRIF